MNMQFRPAKVQRSTSGIYPSEQRWGDIGPAPRSCRWVMGEPAGLSTVYCGEHVQTGSSYCPTHRKRCYRPAGTEVQA